MYTVRVNDVPDVYPARYFPRKYRYLTQAKEAAQKAVDSGASAARIEYPNGAELDYRPDPKKTLVDRK